MRRAYMFDFTASPVKVAVILSSRDTTVSIRVAQDMFVTNCRTFDQLCDLLDKYQRDDIARAVLHCELPDLAQVAKTNIVLRYSDLYAEYLVVEQPDGFVLSKCDDSDLAAEWSRGNVLRVVDHAPIQ